jgi:hypothetical protein
MGLPQGSDEPPKGPDGPLRAPLQFCPLSADMGYPKGPHWGLFTGSFGVEIGPLLSTPRAPCLSFYLLFFNTPKASSWPAWAPLELSRASFLAPWGPRSPQGPLYFLFLTFSKTQTAFTALS